MKPDFTRLQFLLLVFSGWVNQEQQAVIDYLQEENAVLREQLGGRRIRFTDAQRRRLAVKGKALGRRILGGVAGIVTPDTILRWYRRLVECLNRIVPLGEKHLRRAVHEFASHYHSERPHQGLGVN